MQLGQCTYAYWVRGKCKEVRFKRKVNRKGSPFHSRAFPSSFILSQNVCFRHSFLSVAFSVGFPFFTNFEIACFRFFWRKISSDSTFLVWYFEHCNQSEKVELCDHRRSVLGGLADSSSRMKLVMITHQIFPAPLKFVFILFVSWHFLTREFLKNANAGLENSKKRWWNPLIQTVRSLTSRNLLNRAGQSKKAIFGFLATNVKEG